MSSFIEILNFLNTTPLKQEFIKDFKTKLKEEIIKEQLEKFEKKKIKESINTKYLELQKLREEEKGKTCDRCDRRDEACYCMT